MVDPGEAVIHLSTSDDGEGLVKTFSPSGKKLVRLTANKTTKFDRIEVNTIKVNSVFAKYVGIEELLGQGINIGLAGDGMLRPGITMGPEGKNAVLIGYNEKRGYVTVRDFKNMEERTW